MSENKNVTNPQALFWYLTLFFSLGITAFSVGGVVFQIINKFFVEVQYGYVSQSFSQGVLKGSIAALIIAAPAFFFVSYLIRRSLKNQRLEAENKVRLWISYLILFVVVAIAIGDLIASVLTFLNGDFTTRFLLKSGTILLIVGWIFAYYFSELKAPQTLNDTPLPKIAGAVSVMVVIVAIIAGFTMVDSPAKARQMAYDQTRISDLDQIKYSVESYYLSEKALPESLEALREKDGYIRITDPTDVPYEYTTSAENAYQLCATFLTSNKDQETTDYYAPKYGYTNFNHDEGRNCFDFEIVSDQTEGEPSFLRTIQKN
jgi:hypothetical protein